MASIRKRDDNGLLFFDFRLRGQRCRELTTLEDTPANRKRLQKALDKIEAEIAAGTFEYRRYFPNSKTAARFDAPMRPASSTVALAATESLSLSSAQQPAIELPTFEAFAKTWVAENEIDWRRSHRRTVADILNAHVLPFFGEKVVGHITKAEILAFRSSLAKVPGRKAATLSAKRINAIMAPVRQILNEAADRFEFNTPFRKIKPLKVPKTDIMPFTLEQVKQILAKVRPDFRNYYTVRFFTGMRTGEVDGLKWKHVDFERRLILVREAIVMGEEDEVKTEESVRDIEMNEAVYQALKEQEKATRKLSQYVFCTLAGEHLDHNNVTKRVWYPLLRHLDLAPRRPYQTRHTAATLWLAAGENPLWIARQMGHVNTEMLFKVYSGYVPNLTRRDGSAFERLLLQSGAVQSTVTQIPEAAHE